MRMFRDNRDNFSAGVVAKENLLNYNIFERCLKTGRNCFVTNSGTVMRRAGTTRISRTGQSGRTMAFEDDDNIQYHLTFYAGFVDIYSWEGALLYTLAGPWGTDDIFKMSCVADKDQIIIVSSAFFMKKLVVTAGVWTIVDFEFLTEPTGRKAAPFARLAEKGITMLPGAYSGSSVSITFSEDVLIADHVGVHFIYAYGSQIEITAVTDGKNGTGNILAPLFPTYTVTVDDGSAFQVGEIVIGDTTGVRGQVAAVAANVLTLINLDEHTEYLQEDTTVSPTVPGEKLTGPGGSATITTVVKAGSPSATNIWFEELISAARGYPCTATLHKTRLVFGGFKHLKNTIAASAINSLDDFDTGAGTDERAIIQGIGNNRNEQIRHLVSTEELLILTKLRTWYVPETASQRFTPAAIEFRRIGDDQASEWLPTTSTEGAMFIDDENRVLLLSPTGSSKASWATTELTRLGYSNISAPKQLIFSPGIGGRQERAMMVLNGDGTAACFTYIRGAEQAGWFPWDRYGNDIYHSFHSYGSDLYCLAGNGNKINLEKIDFTSLMDGEFDPSDTSYPNESVHMSLGSHVVGTNSTNASGTLVNDIGFTFIDKLGTDFDVKVEPGPYVSKHIGSQRRKIAKVWVDVVDTGTFRVAGQLCQSYKYNTDVDDVPPVVDYEYKVNKAGSSRKQTIAIEQRAGEGAPLHIRRISMKGRM